MGHLMQVLELDRNHGEQWYFLSQKKKKKHVLSINVDQYIFSWYFTLVTYTNITLIKMMVNTIFKKQMVAKIFSWQ